MELPEEALIALGSVGILYELDVYMYIDLKRRASEIKVRIYYPNNFKYTCY